MKIKKLKKSLGQNFLIDQNIINIITDAGNISKNDIILEVGPGSGNLTKEILLKVPKKIFTVEKDTSLCKKLYEKYKNEIVIINDDILKINEKNFSEDPMLVFGNLPYNISTQILVKWIKLDQLNKTFKKFVLMFQKEVAERIIAKSKTKNYGRLSIISQWKMNVKKIMDINPVSFYPKPKIQSSLLEFTPKSNFFNINDVKNLEILTKTLFNKRRKMIKNSIFNIVNKDDFANIKLNIDLNCRPQDLKPEQYYILTREIEKIN